ncbi:MAG: AAA family ATPase [Armatimonadetes bacterium]|nr:AAA family ATPase [Armatimonadota bacterium]
MVKHADWQRIEQSAGTPVFVDFPVDATRVVRWETPTRLALELRSPAGEHYGIAAVCRGEWYPGCPHPVPFSHYEPLLRRAYDGLRALRRPERIRLHLLKAVCAGRQRRAVYLLKFIIGPEHAIEGSQLETVYACPLKAFFDNFLCLPPDCLDRSESIDFVTGRAIHQGYRWAAQARAEGQPDQAVAAAYRRGVIAAFTADFPTFLRAVPRTARPLKAHAAPLRAQGSVARRCEEKFASLPPGARLYHERLFYAPQRGISGKADRILAGDALELYELKTHTSGPGERDPRTGRQAPGGIQALTYHEALRAIQAADETRVPENDENDEDDTHTPHSSLLTTVELYEASAGIEEGGEFTEIPLPEHPVLVKADIPVDGCSDRYLDMVAQNRNVGYLAESGLLTGHDRRLIADLIQSGRRLRGLGGSFEFTGSIPPCSFCAGQTRGICEDAGQYHRTPPMPAFFRRVPDELFRAWAWFHAQVRAELNAVKRHLHRLSETDAAQLESEGICVPRLAVVAQEGHALRLRREARIETRLREGDTVLVSADHARPGDGFSAEARITALERDAVELELSDPALPDAPLYRLDQFSHVAQSRWQAQGLTDFLAAAMAGARAQGRSVSVEDLPWLSRVLLGAAEPALPDPLPLPHLEGVLNEQQLDAVGRALALPEEGILLLQGPPGTGKTQWLAHLVHEIVKARFFSEDAARPVLVLTNTHRAANEVVRKLDATFPELRPYVIRLARDASRWEEEVARHVLAVRLGVAETLRRLDFDSPGMGEFIALLRQGELVLAHAAVFVGTLGSVAADEIKGLAFAYTLVDEAGQATEPATLQALRHLLPGCRGRLILVGDHKQLPPVVPESASAEPVPEVLLRAGLRPGETMRISLFERLARRYPGILLTLEAQYRMNAPICHLVSETFYEGRLHPGAPAVADATLEDLYRSLGARPEPLAGEAATVFDPAVPVVFIDTSDDPAAGESGVDLGADESRDNAREAQILADLLAAYLAAWPAAARPRLAEHLGVISAYRRQNNRIRQELAARAGALAAEVRVDTVDRFQGGERSLLLTSLVSHRSLGRLHHEWRRMNVSLSRAMRKLVIIGSRRTFCAPGGEGLEAEARDYYRRLFATLDHLAAEGRARVLDARIFNRE